MDNLQQSDFYEFCDKCNKENCKIMYRYVTKLEKPFESEGEIYNYAYEVGFCESFIKLIKFDTYYPNNT